MSQQLDQNLMKVDGSTDFECSRKETIFKGTSEASWEGTDPGDEDEDLTVVTDEFKVSGDDKWKFGLGSEYSQRLIERNRKKSISSNSSHSSSSRKNNKDGSNTSQIMSRSSDENKTLNRDTEISEMFLQPNKIAQTLHNSLSNLPPSTLHSINDDSQSNASSLVSWQPISEHSMHLLQEQTAGSREPRPDRREWMDVYRITERDSCSESNSVATSLVVEVESVNEDGSYVGYGGSSESDEDNISNTTLDYVRLTVRRSSSAAHKKKVSLERLISQGTEVAGPASIPGSIEGDDADGYDGDAASDCHSDRGVSAVAAQPWRGSRSSDFDMCTDESESRCQSPNTSVSSSVQTVPTNVHPNNRLNSRMRHQNKTGWKVNQWPVYQSVGSGPPTQARIPRQVSHSSSVVPLLVNTSTIKDTPILNVSANTRKNVQSNVDESKSEPAVPWYPQYFSPPSNMNANNSSLLEKRGPSLLTWSNSPSPTADSQLLGFRSNHSQLPSNVNFELPNGSVTTGSGNSDEHAEGQNNANLSHKRRVKRRFMV